MIAARGESAAFVMVTRETDRGLRWHVVWAERDRATEDSTQFRRSSVLKMPGAAAVGSAVEAVYEGPLAQSGDGRLLAFPGRVRDARSGDESSGLVVAQIVEKPGEPGSFAHRAVRIDTVSVGEAVDECTRLAFAPERPRLFVLGAKHVLAVDLVVDAASGELVAGPPELVDRADDGTPADRGPQGACFGEPVGTDAMGRFVVYGSDATNLDPARRARDFAVYVTDLDPRGTDRLEASNRRTLLVSVDRDGRFLEGSRPAPRISADGRWVVFQSSAALDSDRVIGGHTGASASRSLEYVLCDLDADRDGTIGNTAPRPYLWRPLIAADHELVCTRATPRGWLVTRFHGDPKRSIGILDLAVHIEQPRWELVSDGGEWPSARANAASFDGRWVVGCEDRDLELRDSLADYLRLRRVP
ncbi:MAG: hypothetical protein HZA52_20530 [Planctomycetes bacterium]|nr:hypothetical protein [Planctomycetota bacterium]